MPRLESIIVDLVIYLVLLLATTLLTMTGLYIQSLILGLLITVLHTHMQCWYTIWIRPNAIKVATLIAAIIIWFW